MQQISSTFRRSRPTRRLKLQSRVLVVSRELPSQRKLGASDTPYFGQVAYQELAAYYLEAIHKTNELVGQFPFLVPTRMEE